MRWSGWGRRVRREEGLAKDHDMIPFITKTIINNGYSIRGNTINTANKILYASAKAFVNEYIF